ncbi:MAG: copper transporter [Armatimonadota bacterium]
MIDLRYVALTGIFIFLALAVGMMAGSALGGPDKRDAAYAGLRDEFELLRSENQRVRDENDTVKRRLEARDQALHSLLPLAVRGRLAGTTVAVVVCGGVDEGRFWSELENALEVAGAQVGPVLRLPDFMESLTPQDHARFARIWSDPSATPVAPERRPYEPVGWLLRGITGDSTRAEVRDLASALGAELRAYEGPSNRVLVLTTANAAREVRVTGSLIPEAEVVRTALDRDLRVVVAEPEASEKSVVEHLRGREVATVDNVDTVAGRISTVLALAGQDGHFGSRPGAQPLPDPGVY